MRLSRRIGEMIVAANDLRDAHVVIVDDDRQHVGRRAVGAQQNEIVEILVLEDDASLHGVLDDRLAVLGRLDAHDIGRAGGRLGGVAIAPAAVVAPGALFRLGLLAHLLEFLRGGVAAIGAALRQQRFGDLGMARGARGLVDDLAVPIEAEPLQPVDDGVDRRLRGALAVGVFDAQHHPAAVLLGVEPVEQRRARAADMQKAGGRRSEAGDDL